MLRLSTRLQDINILSLRTGGPVAKITGPLINPNNLKIEGFFCNDRFDKKTLLLLTEDIREQLAEGFVVNDHEVLVEPDDIVRLKKLVDIGFTLLGKHVQTLSKDKVGKVSDYATDFDSFYIQKLYVTQSIVKNLTGGSLVVDRNQINEITSKKIIIDDLLQTERSVLTANL